MIDRKLFYICAKKNHSLPTTLTQEQVNAIEAIFDEWEKLNDPDVRKLAYVLATTKHETANTFLPIEEYGSDKYLSKYWTNKSLRSQLGNIKPSDAVDLKGRGFVMITGRSNYIKAGKLLGIDLIGNPTLAMDVHNAAKIIIYGLRDGWFTGKSFKLYFTHDIEDEFNARKMVNGLDKAGLIAGYYRLFKPCLVLATPTS